MGCRRAEPASHGVCGVDSADRRAGDPDGLRAAWAALEEEWEHHRYAVRDLDAIEAKPHA